MKIMRPLLAGLLLLLPIAVILIVLAKVFQFSRDAAAPILAHLPLENPNAWLLVDGAAAGLLLLVCYLLARLAQSNQLRMRFGEIDSLLVDYFPRYTILKSFVQVDASGADQFTLPQSVAVTIEGVLQIGLEIERNETHAVVFLPDAPSVWSGSFSIIPVGNVRHLDIHARDVARLCRNLGRGSLKTLPRDVFKL